MGWKNWSYWVRGGIIAICVAVIMFVISFALWLIEFTFVGFSTSKHAPAIIEIPTNLIFSILYIISFPIQLIRFFLAPGGVSTTVGGVLGIGTYFAIGALIGWIYGKIKQRGKGAKRK